MLFAFPDYPFTDPARIPRTKYLCREKNTIKGRSIDTNAAAVSRCQFWPIEFIRLLSLNVSGATFSVPPRYINATRRSFHTHRNWKIIRDDNTGTDKGRARRKKAVWCDAPSREADSKISLGIELKKFRNRYMARGRPYPACASHIP